MRNMFGGSGGKPSAEEKELFEAVEGGDVARATELLDRPKVRVNCVGPRGLTPLMHAVRLANVRMVDLLLAKSANVAAEAGPGCGVSDGTANMVLRQGTLTVEGDTALHHAARLNTKLTASGHSHVPGRDTWNARLDQPFDGEWWEDGYKHVIAVEARTVTNGKTGETFPITEVRLNFRPAMSMRQSLVSQLGPLSKTASITEVHPWRRENQCTLKIATGRVGTTNVWSGSAVGLMENGQLLWDNGAVWRRKPEPVVEDAEQVEDFVMIVKALLAKQDAKRLMTMVTSRVRIESQGENTRTVSEDNNGCTPLHLAARYGHPKIVALLLDTAGAEQALAMRTHNGGLPVHWAALEGGRTDVVEMLLRERPNDINDGQLSMACCAAEIGSGEWRGATGGTACPDTLRLLAAKGANLCALENPCNKPAIYNMCALHTAALNGCVEIVNTLVELGVDVNIVTAAKGVTALHYAAGARLDRPIVSRFPGESVVMINALIAAGANPEAVATGSSICCSCCCCVGGAKKPIRSAVKNIPCGSTNYEVVSALIAAGADPSPARSARCCCCIPLWSETEYERAVANLPKNSGPQRQVLDTDM